MRKIDTRAPFFPKTYWNEMQRHASQALSACPGPTNLDARLRTMDAIEAYQQVLSLAFLPLERVFAPRVAIDMARVANDELAGLVSKDPYRFPGFFAALPVASPDAAIEETFRAVKTLGALGVQLFTNVDDQGIDHPDYAPIFRACYQLDVPIYLHCVGADLPIATIQARLVLSGVMDALPGIKIVSHHMGAFTQFAQGRAPGPGGPASRPNFKKPHAEYFKDFYANTSLCGARETMQRGLAYHPRDRVVFASDAPLEPPSSLIHIQQALRRVAELEIDAEWKQDIFWRNAAKIMSFDRGTKAVPGRLLA